MSLADFLGELCAHLRASAAGHDLVCEVAPVAVATDQAISIGLLANELITNALKYAYPSGSGRVLLAVSAPAQGELRLEVSDRGVGLSGGTVSGDSGGLGGRVIASLVRQLDGHAEWQDAEPGTRFVMTFQPQEPIR